MNYKERAKLTRESRINNIMKRDNVDREQAEEIYREQMRSMASKGGKSSSPENRTFYRDRKLASLAGKKANKVMREESNEPQ